MMTILVNFIYHSLPHYYGNATNIFNINHAMKCKLLIWINKTVIILNDITLYGSERLHVQRDSFSWVRENNNLFYFVLFWNKMMQNALVLEDVVKVIH